MHPFLRFLSRQRWSISSRYGVTIATVALATLVRLVAPLDTAPFLLYLPLIFLISLSFGWGPGLVGVVLSDVLAAYFFVHDDVALRFSIGEVVALVQFLVVGTAMVGICAALRRAIISNEATMSELVQSRAAMTVAKNEADAAREAAEDANRAKSAFLANMSHELRTPLSAVIGYSEMLEEEAEEMGETSMLTDLGKIKSSAKHLLSLINDVLDLSKVEANRMDLYVEQIDVAAFAGEAAATVDALIHRKGNTLVLDLPADLGTMRTDAVKLRQCLFNLLSNAAKFTENGRITLSVHREAAAAAAPGGDWMLFAVRDTGIGMTQAQLGRLFQRFVQADETTTRKFGGTGLGLALSRAFAKLLGGDIAVESAEGQGTCFTLRIPASLPDKAADPPAAAEPTAHPDSHDGDRELVLVIDDEPAQRELMTRFLLRQGFAVQTADNGQAGLDLAQKLKPRVILLDVMMPGIDGWSVLNRLKEDAETSKIPVVMVSFVAEPSLSTALGAADAVPKPVDWIKLKGIMDQFHGAKGGVLVVDDDADARHRLRTVLERNGWTVSEAGNGAEALEHVLHAPPHLILLDLTMPVMDGFSFLHRLRATPGCSDIPVVVLSARDINAAERKELAEADRILKKGETSMRDLTKELRQLERRSLGDAAPALVTDATASPEVTEDSSPL